MKNFNEEIVSDTYDLSYITSFEDQKYIISRVHAFTWIYRLFMYF